MFPKRLIALTLFAALAVMPACGLHAQWVQTNGPEGGSISCIAAIDSFVFAGTYAGLFRSTDYGLSWKNCCSDTGITAVAVIGNYVFLGIFDFHSITDQILYSSDRGLTWQPTNFSQYLGDYGVECFAGTDSIILVGTSYGVYCSTDTGRIWKNIGNLTGCYGSTSIVLEGQNIFVAGWCGGVYLSTDLGASWSPRDTGLPSSGVTIASKNSTLFAIPDPNASDGLFRSIDSGLTWKAVQDSSMGVIASIMIVKGNVYASTQSGQVFISTNDGESWKMSSDLQLKLATCNASTNSALYLVPELGTTSLGGVCRSTNGGFSWGTANKGLAAMDISLLTSIGPYIIAVSDFGTVFRTSDEGETWEFCNFAGVGALTSTSCLLAVGSELYLSAEAGLGPCCVSNDSGSTWHLLGNATPEYSQGSILFCLCDSGGVSRSTDNGINWESCNIGLALEFMHLGQYSGYTYSVQTLTSIGSNLLASAWDGIYLSTDQGLKWVKVTTPFDEFSSSCQLNNKLIVASDSGFFSTLDGISWTLLSPNPFSEGNCQLRSSGSELLSFFSGRVIDSIFISSDEGHSWTNADSSSAFYWIGFNAALIFGNYVFVATDGVWRRPLSDFGISSVTQTQMPRSPQLQSYPNPFTQSTQITFTSPDAGYADISIVNLLGEQVAHLFSGEFVRATRNVRATRCL